jgi:hypothetical protein
MLRTILAGAGVAWALGAAAAWAEPLVHGCRMTPEIATRYAPNAPGPARLAELHCVPSGVVNSLLDVGMAPDGDGIFLLEQRKGLSVGGLHDDAKPALLAIDPTFLRLAYASEVGFRWSSKSDFIWGVTQEFALPSHFPTTPLRPIRIGRDGAVTPLKDLVSPPGELDGVLWVGGDGLALASFGLHADRYRPPHSADPVLAIVDFRRGAVRQQIAVKDLELAGEPHSWNGVLDTVATLRPDGNVRVLLRLGPPPTWFLWDVGHAPQPVTLPFADRERQVGVSFLARGDRVLVQPPLWPSGMICEHNPNCPAPTPVTGPLAALYDLRTRHVVWQIEATAAYFANGVDTAVSPDGRYAIINVPPNVNDGYPRAALISLADGKILQTFRGPWNSRCHSGFAADGRSFWLSGGTLFVVYRLAS